MSTPFFLPIPEYQASLALENAKAGKTYSIGQLCERAQIKCKATGDWINRKVLICHDDIYKIEAEPGDWGGVRITLPKLGTIKEAQLALIVLAYGLHDLVAKQSIANQQFAKIQTPKGRIKTGKALSSAERQRLYRGKS